jgi:hypothetical protein
MTLMTLLLVLCFLRTARLLHAAPVGRGILLEPMPGRAAGARLPSRKNLGQASYPVFTSCSVCGEPGTKTPLRFAAN